MSVDMSGSHPAMDVKDKVETYSLFLALCKWTIILVALILIGMAAFLV